MPGPWSYETRTERTARLARAQAQPKDYGSQLDSFLSDRLSKIGIDPGVLATAPPQPAQRATAPSSAPSDGGILRNTLNKAAGFKRQAIADNPGGDSGGGFLSDFASNVKDVAAGALHTGLSVAAKPFELSSEYGSPIFAALTGESRAGRHPILDANGQPTGQFYRDKPDFRDMGASLLGLVTNPVSEYQRGQGAVNERINNPQVQQDFVGRGALRTFSDPLQVGIAALSGGSTALAAPAFNIATEGATQYAQDLPGWRNLSPDVQQALILAGSVIAAKKGPAIARKAAEVTGLKDAYQMGAVPGAAMVSADQPHVGNYLETFDRHGLGYGLEPDGTVTFDDPAQAANVANELQSRALQNIEGTAVAGGSGGRNVKLFGSKEYEDMMNQRRLNAEAGLGSGKGKTRTLPGGELGDFQSLDDAERIQEALDQSSFPGPDAELRRTPFQPGDTLTQHPPLSAADRANFEAQAAKAGTEVPRGFKRDAQYTASHLLGEDDADHFAQDLIDMGYTPRTAAARIEAEIAQRGFTIGRKAENLTEREVAFRAHLQEIADELSTNGHSAVHNVGNGIEASSGQVPAGQAASGQGLEAALPEAVPAGGTTVKRPDLFGNVHDTYQTEAELNGFRPTQGDLLARGEAEAKLRALESPAPPDTAAGSAPEVATPESAPPLAPASDGGNVPPPDSAPPGPPEPPSGGITPGGQEPLPTVQVGPFKLPDITPTPLNRVDRAMNAVKRTLGIGVEEDPMATPAMRARKQAQPVIDAQASRLGAIAQTLVDQAFNRDAKGRITDLVGNPTVQDVAARLPEFAPSLTPEQMRVMEQLRAEVQPYHDLLTKVGVDVNSRADVVDGGFYLPRGRADVEGADLPVKVGSGRSGGVGGRKGFEKGAIFDTQAQGIDAGYQYAPLEEALQSYARDAGNRIIDQHVANYFRNLTDENGVPVGQTPHARVLAQNPAIANQVEGLRKSLDSMRGTAGRLSDRQQAAIDQFLNSPAPDLEELKAALDQRVGLNAVGKAGPNYGKNVTELRQAIRDVRGKVDALMPEWKRALDRARQTPREQGTIGIAQLNGMTFPDVVANAANKYLAAERPPSGRGSSLLRASSATNNLLRGLHATADVSFMGIQGLLGAVRDPIGYGKALGVAFKAIADPQALGKYMLEYDRKAMEKGLPTSKQLIANGLHVGGRDTEFAVRGALPRASKGLQDLPVIKQSNMAFGYFGDTMRLELAQTALENAAKNGFNIADPAIARQVTTAANLATGWSPNTFGGDVGQFATFAPRFLQSQLELVHKGLTDGSLTGQEARSMMGRLIGTGVLLTVAANEASGRPLDYREMFDPTNANFMRIRLGGQDISLFGPWDSLLKGTVSMAKGDVQGANELIHGNVGGALGKVGGGAESFVRGKASPVVGTMWDVFSGQTFDNRDSHTPGYFFRQLLPFSVSDIGQKPLGTTAIGVTGLKASPLSPTEELNQIAQAKYGKDFYDLLSSQQAEIKTAHPDTWQAAVDRGNSNRQKYEAIKTDFTTQQQAADAQLLSGKMTREDWLKQYDDRKTQLAGAQLAIYGKDKPITSPRNASERYAQILQRNQDATGAINWDAVDAEVANLKPEDQAWIQDRQGLGNTPVVTAYKQAAALRSKYFGLPKYKGFTGSEAQQIDALWTQLRANVRVPNTGPMLAELKKLNASGTIDPKVYSGVRRRILGVLRTTKDRERFVRANPAMTTFFGGNGKGGPLTASEAQQLQGAA